MPRKRQSIGISFDIMPTEAGILDPATLAWVAAVISNGGTVSSGRQSLVDAMIKGFKLDGVWSKLDRLWVFAAENQPSALTDMVALLLATTAGSPAFATDSGYTGVDSSTTVYIDTNTNMATYGGQFTTAGGHISAWSNTDAAASATGGAMMGISATGGAADQTAIYPQFVDGNAYFRCADASPSSGVAVTHSLGHYVDNRSTGAVTQGYINAGNVINPNAAAGAVGSTNMVLLAINDSTSGIIFGGAYQLTMASIGANLSATDVSNFYTRLRTYMTAVGVP